MILFNAPLIQDFLKLFTAEFFAVEILAADVVTVFRFFLCHDLFIRSGGEKNAAIGSHAVFHSKIVLFFIIDTDISHTDFGIFPCIFFVIGRAPTEYAFKSRRLCRNGLASAKNCCKSQQCGTIQEKLL